MSGFRVSGLGSKKLSTLGFTGGFGVWGLGFKGLGFKGLGFSISVCGLGFRVLLGFGALAIWGHGGSPRASG